MTEEITFKMESSKKILIMKGDKEIGHIFTPSSTNEELAKQSIQVCGFSEAFDLWGCGCFKGFKDIQLKFDDNKMQGKFEVGNGECIRCYHNPCQCEEKDKTKVPFIVKKSPFGIRKDD